VVLKLDIDNAFNSFHCEIILTAVKNHLRHLHNYVELCYAEPSVSVMIIMSEGGAQQGDPLGSMPFCLAIPPIVVKQLSEFNVWYIDDGTIVTYIFQPFATETLGAFGGRAIEFLMI